MGQGIPSREGDAMKVVTVVLPAAWASALVNGDWSGLEYTDPDQALEAKAWQMTSGLSVLSCSDEPFTASYAGRLTLCLDYQCVPCRPSWEEVEAALERIETGRAGDGDKALIRRYLAG